MSADPPARGDRADSGTRLVRRAVAALIASAVLAFLVAGAVAVFVARDIAEADALAESARTATAIGSVLFAPALPEVLAGDLSAKWHLDRAVRDRGRDGTIVRVKVWTRDNVVVYSDDEAAIGRRFPADDDVIDTIDAQRTTADVSDLSDEENITEVGTYPRLIEVYVPLTLDDGTKLALEIYSTEARVTAARSHLTEQLVPFALTVMLLLALAQLPVAVWLIRRLGRAQEERGRLLRNALTASDRERRSIAQDLHDGVVQDLAGAGYALESLVRSTGPEAPERARSLLKHVTSVVRDAVGGLRTLMIDIYPPDLTAAGLSAALDDLARPLRVAGMEVVIECRLGVEPSPEVAATVYRAARESLVNVVKHAAAGQVTVSLVGDSDGIRLSIVDDGAGLPDEPTGEGHLGLRLLRHSAAELGGELRVGSRPGGGVEVCLDLPPEGTAGQWRTPGWRRRVAKRGTHVEPV